MRRCKVYVHGIEAGILTEADSPREYLFLYHQDYIARKLPPVSLTMPLRESEYRSPVLFPYFFNMLSEGANRAVQSSYLHIDKDDDFGILLETALYDTPGAVTVSPIVE
ncbi:MAG: HipA N-terminal domain-containing protein [Bacteroidales bacterium]|nr:HipA N-terminal domain-containing protein [Bacteroidales bacterium]